MSTDLHPVKTGHPRLFGTRQQLQELARQRPQHYQRMAAVARGNLYPNEDFALAISMGLVYAVEADEAVGRKALEIVRRDAAIHVGHVAWGHNVGAVVFDLCHDLWDAPLKRAYWDWANKTVDANVTEETHVFHNSYYGTRVVCNGLMALATMHDNPRAPAIFAEVDRDLRQRAMPALRAAGAGGGWAEGYYITYFLAEFLTFCEAARRVAGIDYYAMAPEFFSQRAIASMFEMYPGIRARGLREMIPLQDYGTRSYKPPRDRVNPARRILVNYFRNDAAHQAVHAFNAATPRTAEPYYAYLDFLFNDSTVPVGDLKRFKLSHHSPGAGYIYARSSWEDDATYFFFKCGPRFTSHQHLDNGHFLIFKHEELAGDGGHMVDWSGLHDPNYYTRTIAHSTMLVHDPAEQFAGIRQQDPAKLLGNDGGQAFPWRHIHVNGGMADMSQWQQHRELLQTGTMLAYEERGNYMYVAGDCTKSYAAKKLDYFTRQIVFLRPGTFVIFDRVRSTHANFKKTWLLQALKLPEQRGNDLVITHGRGRLFIQTLLPREAVVKLNFGQELYQYDGASYPPGNNTGPAPECRVEISPLTAAREDLFLHLLTATDSTVEAVTRGEVASDGDDVVVKVGGDVVRFGRSDLRAAVMRAK